MEYEENIKILVRMSLHTITCSNRAAKWQTVEDNPCVKVGNWASQERVCSVNFTTTQRFKEVFSRTRSKSITQYITLIVRKGRNSWVPRQKPLSITAVRTSSSNKSAFEISGETSQCWEKAYSSDSRRDNSCKRIKSKRGSLAWHLLKLPKKTTHLLEQIH